MGFRSNLDRSYWRDRGFDLSDSERADIERFFDAWFPIYRRPGTGAYNTQEALNGVHDGYERIFTPPIPDRDRRDAVSALRAGYCVASVERKLGLRPTPDANLSTLFRLMEESEAKPREGPFERAMRRGLKLGEVSSRIVTDPEMTASLRGSPLREAIFADLRATLFLKLKLTNRFRLDSDAGDLAMRFGHAVGVCEEALPATEPRLITE